LRKSKGCANHFITRKETGFLSATSTGEFSRALAPGAGLAKETDIYRYYDLDWTVTVPNMDPHVKQFEILEESSDHVVLRTGFEAVIRKQFADPMPAFLKFETDTIEKLESFRFDDPRDDRRYCAAGDNQIAGVGDGFARNSEPWWKR